MNKPNQALKTVCPSCHTRILLAEPPHLRDIIVCKECEEPLEVVRLNPLKLDWSLLDDEAGWSDAHTYDYRHLYDGYVGQEWE